MINNSIPSSQELEEALKKITFPELDNQNIMQLGIVSSVTCDPDGKALCVLEVPPIHHHAFSQAQKAVEKILKGVKGVRNAIVVLTGSQESSTKKPLLKPSKKELKEKINLSHVRHVIAVASGKGGVGKSTIAANLAVALAKKGLSIGLLDADVYGPSLPLLMGLDGTPEASADKKIMPCLAHGVKCMSMGLLAPKDTPFTWRGPMIQGAVYQMLKDVTWGTEKDPMDYLIVDLPPGTGDIHMTLCQSVPLTGALIVSTPQDLALIDARRAYNMFKQMKVPILGLIENMSFFQCPQCGEPSRIFDNHTHGAMSLQKEATSLGVNVLGSLPLDMQLRQASDTGTPSTALDPNGTIATSFSKIADEVVKKP